MAIVILAFSWILPVAKVWSSLSYHYRSLFSFFCFFLLSFFSSGGLRKKVHTPPSADFDADAGEVVSLWLRPRSLYYFLFFCFFSLSFFSSGGLPAEAAYRLRLVPTGPRWARPCRPPRLDF